MEPLRQQESRETIYLREKAMLFIQFYCLFAPQTCCFFTWTLVWSSLLKYLMIWDTNLPVWNLHTSTWIKVLYIVGATKPKWDIFWLVFMSQLLLDWQIECLIQVLTHPRCAPELLIIQYIIYWWLCWLEELYNQWLCCGCCLVCAVAAWCYRGAWFTDPCYSFSVKPADAQ